MADNSLNAFDAVSNRGSFYNVIRSVEPGVTPFWDSLDEAAANQSKSPEKGHKWYYTPGATVGETNAYAEGSQRADITSWNDVELTNQFQIFKKTAGITGTQAESFTVEEKKNSLAKQEMKNRKQMMLDVEVAMLSAAAPVPALVKTDVRTMAGIKHYIPANGVLDIVNAPLNIKLHIDKAFEIMHTNGIVGENVIVMGGSDVFTDLNHYYTDRKLLKSNDNEISAFNAYISTGWHKRVGILANPNLASNEALIYAPALIKPVLLRQHKSKVVSDPSFDAEAREDLLELTIQSEDPYACIWLKNIGRAL